MNFNLNKRQKIIITSVLITLGLLSGLLTNRLVIDLTLRFEFILTLGSLAYLLSLWSLWEGINKTKAVMLLILPVFYTMAVASFYYVLPIRWFTRLPVAIFFGLSFYLLLLAQNVFNVASLRTIPLYRAASTAGFVLTIFSGLCLFSVVEALNLPFYWNGVGVAIISFPLILQILWAIKIEDVISPVILAQSTILSLSLGELALALSFWPTSANIRSFAIASILTSAMYVLVGITTHHLRERLGKREVWEYLGYGSIVWVMAFFVILLTE
ncbi:MAG: hypothetical protein Q7R49_02120 [Candidatus Daviesbacteria bacterium]|nr:hypothetical protein [Candidatus Daviesbacteria bacterium]